MTRIFFTRFWLAGAPAIVLWAVAACGGDLGLPPATVPNRVDTVTLFALRGTSITAPSAYDLVNQQLVRTDRGEVFDIAFDIDTTGVPLIYPAGALSLPSIAGVQQRNETFAGLSEAPRDDYETTTPVRLAVGSVYALRSRSSAILCSFLGSLPRYGKLHVLALNQTERTVTFELLVDLNCGFLGLEPGIPSS